MLCGGFVKFMMIIVIPLDNVNDVSVIELSDMVNAAFDVAKLDKHSASTTVIRQVASNETRFTL